MKLVFITLLLCLLCFVCENYSQNKKTTGKTKSTKTAKAKTDRFKFSEFKLDTQELPPRFAGHDANILFWNVMPLLDDIECGKYEKTSDCQTRLNKLYDRRLLNGLTARDLVAFSIPVDCDYNPDTELAVCPRYTVSESSGILWSRALVETGSYVGQNLFGVKKAIEYRKIENIYLKVGGRIRSFNLIN